MLADKRGWTPGQCDDIDLDMFWDMIIVADKTKAADGQQAQGAWTENSGPLGKFKKLTRADLAGFKVIN